MSKEEEFGNIVNDHMGNMMSSCEGYGMTWGCRVECPVLRAGECELQDTENKELFNELSEVSE